MKDALLFIAVAVLWGFLASEAIACDDEPEEYEYITTYIV